MAKKLNFNKMVVFWKTSNFHESYVPYYYMLKFFGFTPYKLDVISKKVYFNWMNFIMFVISFGVLSVNSALLVKHSLNKIRNASQQHSVVYDGWGCLNIFLVFGIPFTVILNSFKIETLEQLLNVINEFDELVSSL